MLEKVNIFNDNANAIILGFINNHTDSIFVIFLMVIILYIFTFFVLYLRGLWIEKLKQDNMILEKRVKFFKSESEKDEIADKNWQSNGVGEVFIN